MWHPTLPSEYQVGLRHRQAVVKQFFDKFLGDSFWSLENCKDPTLKSSFMSESVESYLKNKFLMEIAGEPLSKVLCIFYSNLKEKKIYFLRSC